MKFCRYFIAPVTQEIQLEVFTQGYREVYCVGLLGSLGCWQFECTPYYFQERTLLGKCFECISLLAKSVGRDGFKADAEIIMQAMISATQA